MLETEMSTSQFSLLGLNGNKTPHAGFSAERLMAESISHPALLQPRTESFPLDCAYFYVAVLVTLAKTFRIFPQVVGFFFFQMETNNKTS